MQEGVPCRLWWAHWISTCRNDMSPAPCLFLTPFGFILQNGFCLFPSPWAAPWPLAAPKCWPHFCVLGSLLCSGMAFPWMVLLVITINDGDNNKNRIYKCFYAAITVLGKMLSTPRLYAAAPQWGLGAHCGMGAWNPQVCLGVRS